MPPFGAHLSVSGGLHNACVAASALECGTLQIFTKSPNQWAAKPLTDSDVATFRKAARAAKLKHVTAHDSYLINLAAQDEPLWQKSVSAFVHELESAERLGLSYLVTHPGAHVGSGDEAGLARVVAGLDEAMRQTAGFKVMVLLETTAGQGTSLGHRFEHLATLLRQVAEPARVGVCFDTCHVFAAGYDLATAEGYDATFAEFDRVVGLKRLKLFHLNDSVKGCGSRVDRHAGLGRGQIGEGCFQRLVRDRRFVRTPMILETPKETDGVAMDPVNLGLLRQWSSEQSA